jgi:hypothetical protein
MATDSRIKYYRQDENKGAQFNFLFVLEKATGEYFMWAADDDLWDILFIESLVVPLSMKKENVSAFCPYAFIDMDDNIIESARSIDYSHRSLFFRVVKICMYYDDGCIYGLHRADILKRVKWPIWWSVNAKTPINTAYPPIFYLIASGGLVYVKTRRPLWFNRLRINTKIQADHDSQIVTDRGDPLSEYFAFILRKINVLYESERSIWQGSHSIVAAIFTIFPLITRCAFDCIQCSFQNIAGVVKLLNARIWAFFR